MVFHDKSSQDTPIVQSFSNLSKKSVNYLFQKSILTSSNSKPYFQTNKHQLLSVHYE